MRMRSQTWSMARIDSKRSAARATGLARAAMDSRPRGRRKQAEFTDGHATHHCDGQQDAKPSHGELLMSNLIDLAGGYDATSTRFFEPRDGDDGTSERKFPALRAGLVAPLKQAAAMLHGLMQMARANQLDWEAETDSEIDADALALHRLALAIEASVHSVGGLVESALGALDGIEHNGDEHGVVELRDCGRENLAVLRKKLDTSNDVADWALLGWAVEFLLSSENPSDALAAASPDYCEHRAMLRCARGARKSAEQSRAEMERVFSGAAQADGRRNDDGMRAEAASAEPAAKNEGQTAAQSAGISTPSATHPLAAEIHGIVESAARQLAIAILDVVLERAPRRGTPPVNQRASQSEVDGAAGGVDAPLHGFIGVCRSASESRGVPAAV